MTENTDKLYGSFRNIFSVLLPVFYVFGVIVGTIFVYISEAYPWNADSTWRLSGLYRTTESSFLSVFSGYLFDFIFVFLVVALFGVTFLGIAVIPITVLCKGMTQGITLSMYLAHGSTLLYLQRWITYIPAAALGMMVFLFYSIYAGSVSLHLLKTLISQKHITVHLRLYLLRTIVTLLAFTVVSLIQYILDFLLPILF